MVCRGNQKFSLENKCLKKTWYRQQQQQQQKQQQQQQQQKKVTKTGTIASAKQRDERDQ